MVDLQGRVALVTDTSCGIGRTIDLALGAPFKASGRVEVRIPVGRMELAVEVAQATFMVIGNSFITGQTIPVNGGLALP